MYISLYRKYRPRDFSEVVGQDVVCKTLQNAISLNRLSHAYLFSGPRGTGKTTMARILAKCLNCENGPTETPCNKCSLCKRIQEGHCLDIIEIDAASHRGIDDIRDLREKIKFSPTEAKHKIYIIDEIHQLSTDAKDAILKTLEEPPENTFFIFATTEPHKLAPTIHSRCQHFEFKRISIQDMQLQLKKVAKEEKIQSDEKTLALIASAADGALRDALSLLDQMTALCGKILVHDDVVKALGITEHQSILSLMTFIADHNAKEGLVLIEELVQQGKDLQQVLKNLIEGFRTLLLCKVLGSTHPLMALTKEAQKDFETLAARYETSALFRILNDLSSVEYQMKKEMQPRILLEMAVVRLTQKTPLAEKREIYTSPPAHSAETAKETAKSIEAAPQPTKTVLPAKEEHEEQTQPTAEPASDLQGIQKQWKKILSELEKKKRSVYSLVFHAVPVKCTSDELTLAFTKDNDFPRSVAEKYKDVIEKVILEVTHKNYHLRMIAAESIDSIAAVKENIRAFPAEDSSHTSQKHENEISVDDILQTFEGSTVVKESK